MPGWNSDISSIKNYGDLPENAKKYIEFIANKLEVTIDIVSTGPARSATIIRKDFFAKTNS